ncbi:GL21788 [Drosophila persimilis]|uniref:GL21788 n=1 Tax=Drosophila persimilis TaxID=7234 RepID=B4H6S1_DROPE|nr:GL21788 [Drosophila persimilis]
MLVNRMQLWRATNAAAALNAATARLATQHNSPANRRDMHLASHRIWSAQLSRHSMCLVPPQKLVPPALMGSSALRFASTGTGGLPESVSTKEIVDLPDIPEAPTPPAFSVEDVSSDVFECCWERPHSPRSDWEGWTPVGVVQNCMEFLHCTLGAAPGWGAIAVGTLVVRTIHLFAW